MFKCTLSFVSEVKAKQQEVLRVKEDQGEASAVIQDVRDTELSHRYVSLHKTGQNLDISVNQA